MLEEHKTGQLLFSFIENERCRHCNGKGFVLDLLPENLYPQKDGVICKECDGSGKRYKETGVIDESSTNVGISRIDPRSSKRREEEELYPRGFYS